MYTVAVGDNVTLTCDTRRSDPPATTINITRDGNVLSSTDSSVILQYIIVHPTLEDNGAIYECTAVNDIGYTTKPVTLAVKGEWVGRSVGRSVGRCVSQGELVGLSVSLPACQPTTYMPNCLSVCLFIHIPQMFLTR